MSITYLLLRSEDLDPVGANADHWCPLAPTLTPPELETELGKPETDGWIHQVGASPETPDTVLRRAVAFKEKLSILGAPIKIVATEFVGNAGAAKASLFFCLDGYELLGEQLRSALSKRAPYCFTAHILRERFPDRHELDPEFGKILDHFFLGHEFRYTIDELCDDNPSVHHHIYEISKRKGIASIKAIVDSCQALRFAYGVIVLKMTAARATEYCGGIHRQTLHRICERVFSIGSVESLRGMTMEQCTILADVHIFAKDFPLPPLAPLRFNWREREREREREQTNPRQNDSCAQS